MSTPVLHSILTVLVFSFWGHLAAAAELSSLLTDASRACVEELAKLPGKMSKSEIEGLCSHSLFLNGCVSQQGKSIFHFDHPGSSSKGKRVLALSLIHGDELPAGAVTRAWIKRLEKIDPRNSWRIIPVANPDGFKTKKRTNANGVDLNRNFPTKEWADNALKSWIDQAKSDPRRYPGPHAGSEAETKCLLAHIDDFKPDFVISIHTPIGVLDFDGPPVSVPRFAPLPWSPLGNFPGSLGRYMWKDKNIPVLTIELKGNSGVAKLDEFDRLQDISGSIAIEALKQSQSGLEVHN